MPNADFGRISVAVPLPSSTTNCSEPTALPPASTHTGDAKPWTSMRWLQASAEAIV